MINPVQPAIEYFIDMWNCIPTVIQSFVFLCFGLWAVTVVIGMIFR